MQPREKSSESSSIAVETRICLTVSLLESVQDSSNLNGMRFPFAISIQFITHFGPRSSLHSCRASLDVRACRVSPKSPRCSSPYQTAKAAMKGIRFSCRPSRQVIAGTGLVRHSSSLSTSSSGLVMEAP
jgi:hypothetical protein